MASHHFPCCGCRLARVPVCLSLVLAEFLANRYLVHSGDRCDCRALLDRIRVAQGRYRDRCCDRGGWTHRVRVLFKPPNINRGCAMKISLVWPLVLATLEVPN